MDNELINLAMSLGQLLKTKGLKIAIAESCTGGGLCQLLTEISGSSHWFECGFICYSNQSKQQMLDVKAKTLESFGAVSKETALEMVQGALVKSHADCAIAITGIAGPDGGSEEKPVGTIFIALQSAEQSLCYQKHFKGTRHEIRRQATKFALEAISLIGGF